MSRILTADYHRFAFARMPTGMNVPVRLFLHLPKNNKMVLFRNAEFLLELEEQSSYQKRKLNEVYIHNDEWPTFLAFLSANDLQDRVAESEKLLTDLDSESDSQSESKNPKTDEESQSEAEKREEKNEKEEEESSRGRKSKKKRRKGLKTEDNDEDEDDSSDSEENEDTEKEEEEADEDGDASEDGAAARKSKKKLRKRKTGEKDENGNDIEEEVTDNEETADSEDDEEEADEDGEASEDGAAARKSKKKRRKRKTGEKDENGNDIEEEVTDNEETADSEDEEEADEDGEASEDGAAARKSKKKLRKRKTGEKDENGNDIEEDVTDDEDSEDTASTGRNSKKKRRRKLHEQTPEERKKEAKKALKKEKENKTEKLSEMTKKSLNDKILDLFESSDAKFAAALANAMDLDAILPEGAHALNVCHHSLLIAMALGNTDPEFLKDLMSSALLHDIGITQLRIRAPDKDTEDPNAPIEPEFRLEPEEHLKDAEVMLQRLMGAEKAKALLPIVNSHHERYDGQGYPNKIKGDEIPIGGQILALANHVDHLMSGRYDGVKRTFPDVLDTLRFQYMDASMISEFDPKLIQNFMKAIDEDDGTLHEQAELLENEVLGETMKLDTDQVRNRTKAA